ncbi:aspartyl/asparaginyl beta-hydroxylase domain-containing protein [Vibrio sp. 10N]|uniref:aspartyl/asparaginyl beta-hydroxylase domain-containing protein n=1 Tax=Vibrio sp. 10N TaxID=3058938 RepID=UPI002812DE0D|nr:aspartyl/asparaginyl beta-hydroxylase domain-containing protein [Vibrio sp. 10N]
MELCAKFSVPLDTQALIVECRDLFEDMWCEHVNRHAYKGQWDVIPLRVPIQHVDSHPILQCFAIEDEEEWCNLDVVEKMPRLRDLLNWLNTSIQSVRLMRLHPKSMISPHRDIGLCHEMGLARLHLPVSGSDSVAFWVAGYQVPMEVGQLWYINADMTHSVENQGSLARVNLVIDCKANKWLKRQIELSEVVKWKEEVAR